MNGSRAAGNLKTIVPPHLTDPRLDAEAGLVHGFSTAAMGSMGLSHAGDRQAVVRRRAGWAEAAGLQPGSITVAGAVHGVGIARVDEPVPLLEGVDGLVTDRPGVTLLATFADCYPLLAYDPRRRAAGLAHAGWRGTAAGIAGRLVEALGREYGSAPADLLVAIGPGICGGCYEVGPEFGERFPAVVFRAGREDRLLLDLREANRLQLVAAGVAEERISAADRCTYESVDLFSHRRSPDGTRFAALVALR